MYLIEELLKKIIEYKDFFLIISGWILAVMEFIINRKIIRKDKKQKQKYHAYLEYTRKADEIMNSIRKDPNELLDLNSNFHKNVINNIDNEKIIGEYLIKYNEQIKEFVINSTKPLLILRQELNEMKLICSKELLKKIEDMDKLFIDYNNAVQENIRNAVHNDINSTVNALQTLTQDKRFSNFENLHKEILNIMRKEIGN